ncbi:MULTISPECIES: hypothetical protein [unclassified Amycolatopsis]|uniref:hypothetical protein n=1 Tax=unclassified Amycolatopsis TaxID=2618356 RepID=UPI002E21AAD3|nr:MULTISPECIES: hypothetical protein [unclassified Amycolatopsis]
MTGERQVRLRLGTRAVSAPAEIGREVVKREVVKYAGITVQRVEDGELVEQTWIPVGEAPTFADDEALIAEWHQALRWTQARADV